MPIYEYQCADCQHRFETLVSVGMAVRCPACQGAQVDKQFSVFAVGATQSAPAQCTSPCGSCGDGRGPGGCRMGWNGSDG